MTIAARRLLPASGIRKIFDQTKILERSGFKITHLDVGRPAWPISQEAIEAVKAALDDGLNQYIANRGLSELRQAISDDLTQEIGVTYDPESEIVVTLGASEAVSMCALALLGPGDEVILPLPAWNHYEAVIEMAGAKVIALPLRSEDQFVINPDDLEQLVTPKTRMLILNTPNNPTGAVQPDDVLKRIADSAIKHNFYVLSDEVYRDFIYDQKQTSIAKYLKETDLLLYVYSFSKSFAITGWRVGYLACAEKVSDAVNRIHQYLTVCGVPCLQKGVEILLRSPHRKTFQEGMKEDFQKRLGIWEDAMRDWKKWMEIRMPRGAFYLFPRIHYRNMTGRQFCEHMLDKHHVAMVPGEVFGQGYEKHVRISYGLEMNIQKEAVVKMNEVFHEEK